MSWLINCFSSREEEYRVRELGYIKELRNANDKILTLVKDQGDLEEQYRRDQNRWDMKEDVYLEKINEMQGLLHEQEVITQQYKIYEGNFQQERQQLQEVQKHIEKLKLKADNQEKLIEQLQTENKKYLNIILDFRRGERDQSGENDSGYSSEFNSVSPQITKSVLV